MRHKRAQDRGQRTEVRGQKWGMLALQILLAATVAAQNNPMPIRNGVLQNNLNANGKQIINLDTSNLGLGGGGGIDTGTTTAILAGNGSHGIRNAVAGTDYLAPSGSGILLTGVVLTANNLSDIADAAVARTSLGLGNVDNTSDLSKPVSTATTTALGLKADTSAMTTALAAKADAAATTTALAGKEPLLPTTGNDSYILARHNSGGSNVWFFVDPVTLGTTSQTFTDGVENSTTTFTSATANFVAGDVGKTITGTNIPASTTIASRTNSTTVVLSNAATATASGITFTILNRLVVGGTGTVTAVSETNNAAALLTIGLTNPNTSPAFTFDTPTVAANTLYGNSSAFAAAPSFMSPTTARTSLGLGTMALQTNTGSSTAIQKGNGTGGFAATVAGTDYLAPAGSGTSLTGVVKTANNLSDVNAALAKGNLGLASVASTGAFFDLAAPVVGTNTFYGNPAGTTAAAVFMTASAARTALSLATTAADIQKGDGSGGTQSATANTDYAKDTAQVGTNATNSWTSGITNFIEGAGLTATQIRNLPPTTGYGDGTTIKYTDSITTANVGPGFIPSGSDTLKGITAATWAAAPYTPFTAGGNAGRSKTVTFQKRGTDWRVYSIGGESLFAVGLQSRLNVNGVSSFNTDALTAAHSIFVPNVDTAFVVPSNQADATVWASGIDSSGNILYNAPALVPTTSGHTAGESLKVQSDGSYNFSPANAGTGYQVLNGATDPIVWTCMPGETHQSAIVTLTGTPGSSHALQINGAASGNTFDLIVKQDGTGSRTISAMPTGSYVTPAGAGIPTLTAAASATDWLKGTYSGQTGAQWLWTVFPNATAAAPPSCTTLGVTGATTGTTAMSQNTSGKVSLANGFIADATSVCKVEANLYQTGATTNYDVKVLICPDTVRATITGSSTTAGLNVVSLGSTASANDIGQAVTFSAGFASPSTLYYISAVDTVSTPKTITLVTTRGGSTPANASTTVTGTVSAAIYGIPGTPINGTGSDPVNSLSLPASAGAADTTPAVFTNVNASGMTISAFYFVKIAGQGTFGTTSWDTSDYVTWLYSPTLATGYNIMANSAATGGTWNTSQTSRKMRFKTYH